jgi:hypothetical protein
MGCSVRFRQLRPRRASHYLPSHEKFPPNPAPKSGKLPNRVARGALMDEETMFAFDCELSPSRKGV